MGLTHGQILGIALLVAAVLVVTLVVFLAGRLFRSEYSPYKYVKGLLYSSEPLKVSTPLSLDAAQRKLNGALTRIGIPYVMSTRLVGYARDSRFKISLHRRFQAGSGSSVLTGTLFRSSSDGQTMLQGEFRVPMFIRGFMTLWFGFLGIWSAVGIPAGIIMLLTGQWQGILFVAVPLLMFGFGVGFVKIGGGLSGKDRRLVAEKIADAVGGSVVAEN
jgi:hypothetical protein